MFSGFAVHIQQKVILNWMHHLSSCPCPLSHTAWMLLCSPECMAHSALGRDCAVQLFILAFSVNPPTEPLWSSSVSMHVSWKQHNNPGFLCLLLAWLLGFSVAALYWKKWSVRLLAACVLGCLKKLEGRNTSLLVFYHMNYLPFDQCFPSLWTLLVFWETKKIDEILKPKPNRSGAAVWIIAPLLLTCAGEARHCSFLLLGVTGPVSVKIVPLRCTCPFLQADFPRAGEREWALGMDSLEELIHLQLDGNPVPTPTSGVWEHQELQRITLYSNKFVYRLGTPDSAAQLPVHTNSLCHRQLTRRCYPSHPQLWAEPVEGEE